MVNSQEARQTLDAATDREEMAQMLALLLHQQAQAVSIGLHLDGFRYRRTDDVIDVDKYIGQGCWVPAFSIVVQTRSGDVYYDEEETVHGKLVDD